ncbi:MAG: metallo-beta-lactamase [Desulfatitalea sp. BRH_c12]|nr:MAG: metallo-beta-lactamase [Desulfatitalea sp. BRH_c12]
MNYPIIHLGGETCVTGSCHLLQVQGLNILVDCGITQGNDRCRARSDWPVKASEIDFIFLTHAHVDHIGMLPSLIKDGFAGEIICSHPTKAIIAPMLNDAMRFSDVPQGSREGIQRRIDEQSWGFEYGQTFDLKKGVAFTLGRAGHILGSCFIRFECRREGFSVIFSGDLGNRDTPVLPDPDRAEPADLLILESTYGDRRHADRSQRLGQLALILDRSLADGGKVFIPAFALGRTQEILYDLDRIFTLPEYKKHYPNLNGADHPPVFVDTPLGLEITAIYSSLAEYWDQEARDLLVTGDHPLDFGRLFAVEKHYQHDQLLDVKGPAIIIAGSGMCTGGRIVDHLAAGIADPKNDIVLVGYMAEGTPGRQIQDAAEKGGRVLLDGAWHAVRAGVHVLSGYSAHADQQGLLDWVGAMAQAPGRIKLVHGAQGARAALAAKLAERGCAVV